MAGRWTLMIATLLSAVIGATLVLAYQRYASSDGDTPREATERVVRDYILNNPEILPEAMERLRAREVGKVVDANRDAVTKPFGSAWAGAANGDVTVVAYMDYNCGYCRASLPVIRELLKADPKVRIVYRELPILSPESRTAAQWSLAAAEQGKFQAFHDALYAGGQVSDATIRAAATTAGLDQARAARVAASPEVTREIQTNLALASQLGITGTPSWVIGNNVTSGALPLAGLRTIIGKVRAGK